MKNRTIDRTNRSDKNIAQKYLAFRYIGQKIRKKNRSKNRTFKQNGQKIGQKTWDKKNPTFKQIGQKIRQKKKPDIKKERTKNIGHLNRSEKNLIKKSDKKIAHSNRSDKKNWTKNRTFKQNGQVIRQKKMEKKIGH